MAARGKLNKLFVGNLPWTVGREDLLKYFAQFGPISSANVIFDKKTGFSKGYGFVVYSSKDGVQNATGKQSHLLEGNKLNVEESKE